MFGPGFLPTWLRRRHPGTTPAPRRRFLRVEILEDRELLSASADLFGGPLTAASLRFVEGVLADRIGHEPTATEALALLNQAHHPAGHAAGPDARHASTHHGHHGHHRHRHAGPSALDLGSLGGWHFDFGGKTTPVAPGYSGVGPAAFSPALGYGWLNAGAVNWSDRGTANPLTRDFVWGRDATFAVNVPDGTYGVTLTLGDARAAHPATLVFLQGQSAGTAPATAAGQFTQPTYQTTVIGGTLQLRLVSAGTSFFALDGLDVRLAPQSSSGGRKVTASAGPAEGGNEGSPVAFSGSATGGVAPYSYAWSFGDGTTASGTATPSHAYGDDGTYTVTLVVTDGRGRTATSTTTATIADVPPTAAITGAPPSGQDAVGSPVTLGSQVTDPGTADTKAGFTYSWTITKNGAPFASGTSATETFTPDAPGTYVATLTATDSDGAASAPASTTITAVTATPPTVTVSGAPASGHGPEGTAVTLTATASDSNPSPTFTYAWTVTKNGAAFASGTSATETFTPDDTGTYVATVTATDTQTGLASSPVSTTVVADEAPPVVQITGAPYGVTPGTAITLGSSVSSPAAGDAAGGYTYAWTVTKDGNAFASGTAATIIFTPDTDGTYVATLAVTDAEGQTGTSSVTIATNATYGLNIPATHPRLWYTQAGLDQLKQWWTTHGFVPDPGDPTSSAMAYLATGNLIYGQNAVNGLMAFTITADQLQTSYGADILRWNYWPPMVFDWVHDLMTPDQVSTFVARYNSYLDAYFNWQWAGTDNVADNYFWGQFRNELNWGIASYGDNPEASKYLQDTLQVRWPAFVQYASTDGVGGAPAEGVEYGEQMQAFPMTALVSAGNLGDNLLGQTNWYKESVMYQVYATTPTPTQGPAGFPPYYQMFGFGTEGNDRGYQGVSDNYSIGEFMDTMAQLNTNNAIGQYARQWINTVQPQVPMYDLSTDPGGPALDFSNLPTDYYAGGTQQFFYTRDQWGPQGTMGLWQLGRATHAAHLTPSAGAFQIWRGGEWLTRNTMGYDAPIAGYQGNGTGSTAASIATNTILYDGLGQAAAIGPVMPNTLRLQSTPTYDYAAVDMSPAYESPDSRFNNPAQVSTVREMFFIKPLDAYVVFDRVQSASASDTKTFLLHSPGQFQQTGANTWAAVNGGQEMDLTSLTPGPTTFDVVDESNIAGPDPSTAYQYRLEENQTGSAQSYLINVIQAKSVGDPSVAATLTDNGSSWTITLTSPTKGTAVLVLNKGMASQGGTVGYAATGTPAPTPLIDHVQSIQVTDNGPVWGT